MMKRIHDGAIGEIVGGQCYWNQGDLWVKKQTPGMSEMEWQCRNWLYFTWLSGDHIVEQHVHNIDVINWAFRAMPVKIMGMGGRAAGTAPEYGNIYDHFAIEFEYPERRPRHEHVPADPRAAPSASRRRSSGPRARLRLRRDHRRQAAWKFEGEETEPLRRRSTRTSSPPSGPASRSTRASGSPRARCARSWAG